MSLKFLKDSFKFVNASGRALKAAHREFFNPSKIEEFPKHSGGGKSSKKKKNLKIDKKKKNSLKKKIISMNDTQIRATTLFDIEKNIELGDIDNLMSQHKILIQLRDNIIPKIKKHQIKCFIVPIPLSSSLRYYDDYCFHYLEENYGEDWDLSEFIHLNIFLNSDLTIDVHKPLEISYGLSIKHQQLVADILLEQFPYNYIWNGSDLKKMFIHFQDRPQKSKTIKVSSQSNYPQLWITGHLETNSEVQNGLFSFDYMAITKAKELTHYSKVNEKVNLIEIEYGDDDFIIKIIGIKQKDLGLVKNLVLGIKKVMTLTIENEVLKIKDFEAHLYNTESNFEHDNFVIW